MVFHLNQDHLTLVHEQQGSRSSEKGSDSCEYNGDSFLEMTSVKTAQLYSKVNEYIGLGTVAGKSPDCIKQHAPILMLPI